MAKKKKKHDYNMKTLREMRRTELLKIADDLRMKFDATPTRETLVEVISTKLEISQ